MYHKKDNNQNYYENRKCEVYQNQYNNHLNRCFEELSPKGSEMKLAPMPTTKSELQNALKKTQKKNLLKLKKKQVIKTDYCSVGFGGLGINASVSLSHSVSFIFN